MSHLRDEHDFRADDRRIVSCAWAGCTVLHMRKNIPRHIVSRHMLTTVPCPECGRVFSRADVARIHQLRCNGTRSAVAETAEEDKGSHP